MTFQGVSLFDIPIQMRIPSPNGTRVCHKKLETLSYHMGENPKSGFEVYL